MPDTRDLTAVIDDSGFPIGWRSMERPPRFVAAPLLLDQQGAPIVHTGTAVATMRRQIIVPGGLLGPNGRVRWELDLQLTSSANVKNVDMRVNGTSVYNAARTTPQWERFEMEFCNAGTEASQQTTLRTASGVGIINNYNFNSLADMTFEVWMTLAQVAETITLHKSVMLVYPTEG